MSIPFIPAIPPITFPDDCIVRVIPLFEGIIQFTHVARIVNLDINLDPPVSFLEFNQWALDNIFLPYGVEEFNSIAYPEDEKTYFPNNFTYLSQTNGFRWQGGLWWCEGLFTSPSFSSLSAAMNSDACGNFVKHIKDNIIPTKYNSISYPFTGLSTHLSGNKKNFILHQNWYIASGQIINWSITYHYYKEAGINCYEGDDDTNNGGGGDDGGDDIPPCDPQQIKIKITSIPAVRARVTGSNCE